MSSSSRERQYWDASVVCAIVSVDDSEDDRRKICLSLVQAALDGEIEVVTSAISLAEVTGGRLYAGNEDVQNAIVEFFQQPFVLLQNVDRAIAREAHQLRVNHQIKDMALPCPDAIHLATAKLTPRVIRMFTYDEKHLVRLSMQYQRHNGDPLPISTPTWSGQPRLI